MAICSFSGIRTKLYPLGDNVTVLPGHGPPTTIGEERRTNPFVALTAITARRGSQIAADVAEFNANLLDPATDLRRPRGAAVIFVV